MRRLILTAVCTAAVEEAWRFDVPDDFDTSGTPEEVFDRAMGNDIADPFDQQSPPGVEFRGVENVEVNDEHDREWRALGVEEVAPPATGNTHRAVIETSVPPGMTLIAAGPKEFCQNALANWLSKHPLGEYDQAIIMEVVSA